MIKRDVDMENILIIEDNRNLSNAIKIYLNDQNYSVVQSFDGNDGLDKIMKNKYDLVGLDLVTRPRWMGYPLTSSLEHIATSKSLHERLSPEIAIIAFLVSAGTGLLAGLYPANKASRWSLIEALRYG